MNSKIQQVSQSESYTEKIQSRQFTYIIKTTVAMSFEVHVLCEHPLFADICLFGGWSL